MAVKNYPFGLCYFFCIADYSAQLVQFSGGCTIHASLLSNGRTMKCLQHTIFNILINVDVTR